MKASLHVLLFGVLLFLLSALFFKWVWLGAIGMLLAGLGMFLLVAIPAAAFLKGAFSESGY